MADLRSPETCRSCGARVHFIPVEEQKGETTRWQVVNADWSLHSCHANVKVKVYTEEEKREFARRRAAGEI